ncbi:MAG: hypothetical protein J7M18_04460, partial [Candidatus Eremiobacteraeota bacterium]|nr:hypothetical protein [Candidatus Eremiobacteraeota bacterium]
MKQIDKMNNNSSLANLPVKRLLFCFFVQGFYSLVIQSLLFREFLVVYFGNELVIGMLLGSWLIAISIGSWLYPRVFKQETDRIKWIRWLMLLLAILPFIQVFIIRGARGFLSVPLGLMLPFIPGLIYAFIVIVPVGLLLGMLFPLGAGIMEPVGPKGTAWLYSAESLGFMAGGVTF